MNTFSIEGSKYTFKEIKKLKKNHCHFCFLFRFDCEGAKCGLEGKERTDNKIDVFTIQQMPDISNIQ